MARTEDVLARVAELASPEELLSVEDRARHDQLHFEADRRSFVAARALTRLLLVVHDGLPLTEGALRAPDVRQRCGRCERPHGRPYVVGRADLGLSWSHKRDVVAAAVGRGPVGVDVEHVAGVPPPLVGRTPRHAAPATAHDPTTEWLSWTRAEACVKVGLATLTTATGWSLTWPTAPGGTTWVVPGVEEAVTGDVVGDVSQVMLTDRSDPDMGVVCTVAGRVPAVLVTF
ncbi:hypothetical protein IEQ44_05850 [Nocardioides sp. Y6]|uniref:4'-phosphopantetheinyl transferase superfamily protein n=1 Tax=Nocardioides malaquae TaxID=2773426 RepID=A0ABR9RRG6_9ACTN|nr:hypothetical protein [Nocardioides malaquae]